MKLRCVKDHDNYVNGITSDKTYIGQVVLNNADGVIDENDCSFLIFNDSGIWKLYNMSFFVPGWEKENESFLYNL